MRDRILVSLCGAFFLLVLGPASSWAAPPEEDARLLGYWRLTWETDESQREYYLDLREDGDKITGSFISPRSGGYPVKSATVSGEKAKIVVVRKYGGVPVELNIEGEFDGKRTIHGTVGAQGNKMGDVSMRRLPDPLGAWAVKSVAANGTVRESVLKVARTKAGYTGTFVRGGGSTKAKAVAWKADHLVIEVSLPAGGREITFAIDAEFSDRNTLKGRWTVGDRASGEWSASREHKEPLHNPVGRWTAVSRAKSGVGTKESVLEIAAEGSGYKANYSGERGEAKYRRVTCDGDELRLELEVEVQGTPVTYLVTAEFSDANTLKGRWVVKDYREYAGEWSATRPAAEKP